MASNKVVGAIVLGMGAIVGCGGSSDPPAAAELAAGTGGSDGTSDGGITPVVCGGEGQPCCASGALCAAGLSCSDQSCLRCGPAPMPLAGCTNVAPSGISTAGAFGTTAPDDPAKVIDDDVCTSWNYGSYADADSRWTVDLRSAYSLEALTLWPKMTPSEGTVQFLIEYKVGESDAYVAWPTSAGLALTLYDYKPWQTTFSPAITARYFRVTIQGTPSFVALREVGLYANCSPASDK